MTVLATCGASRCFFKNVQLFLNTGGGQLLWCSFVVVVLLCRVVVSFSVDNNCGGFSMCGSLHSECPTLWCGVGFQRPEKFGAVNHSPVLNISSSTFA